MLKKWLEKRKLSYQKSEYNRGFDWAAGALIRKDLTPFEIECFIDGSLMTSNEVDFFDKGALEAVFKLTKGVIIEDNHPMNMQR